MSLEQFAKRNVREKELEEEIERRGMAPVGSLMFSEVERRLDVFLFRCCFSHSVYDARRLILHGYVTLNGRKVFFLSVLWFMNPIPSFHLALAAKYPTRTW